MKLHILLAATVLSLTAARPQLVLGYQGGAVPFAEAAYEIGDRWEPALRISTDRFLEDLGRALAITYDVYEREAVELFVGSGVPVPPGGSEANVRGIVPLGMNVHPLADRRFGLRAVIDLGINEDPVLVGTRGLRWRLRDAD